MKKTKIETTETTDTFFLQFSPYKLEYKLFKKEEVQEGIYRDVTVGLFGSKSEAIETAAELMGCKGEVRLKRITTFGTPIYAIVEKS